MTKQIEADWTTWAFIPSVTLQDAVFLSLDLEPAPQGFNHALVKACAKAGNADPIEVLHEFNRRMTIASANIKELAGSKAVIHIHKAKVPLSKFGAWAEKIGWSLPDKFPRQIAPEQEQPAAAPPTETAPANAPVTEAAPALPPTEYAPERDAAIALPTSTIASCFAAFNGWDFAQWKKNLQSPSPWLKACRHQAGEQGKPYKESTWWPVAIALKLSKKDPKNNISLRKRFKNQEPLKPWLDVIENNLPDDREISVKPRR